MRAQLYDLRGGKPLALALQEIVMCLQDMRRIMEIGTLQSSGIVKETGKTMIHAMVRPGSNLLILSEDLEGLW